MISRYLPGRALFGAAIIIGLSAILAWLEPAHISTETSRRLLGVLLGCVVLVYANAIPKLLVGRARHASATAADQAARRFAGWSIVLGALGYMLAWLVAPVAYAAFIGGALLALSLLAAILRCMRRGPSSET